VQQQSGQPELAEEAYNEALSIMVRLGNQAGQAGTLGQLGNLYLGELQRPGQAVAFYQRSAEIYHSIADIENEGSSLSNLANALRNLQRLEEAREAITKANQCFGTFGHAAEPWKHWSILAAIETDAGNPSAATDARENATAAYLTYRRNGGENNYGSGRLAQLIQVRLSSGDLGESNYILQQLAADPRAVHMLPFITALQAITAGSRESSLAEDPVLDYTEAAEVLLLIEALESADRR
jgi:tetratricopeptide (TPR) repeat protein